MGSLSFLVIDHYEGNASISAAIKSGSTVIDDSIIRLSLRCGNMWAHFRQATHSEPRDNRSFRQALIDDASFGN